VFDSLIIHGGAGSLLWGHRVAVEVSAWKIARIEGRWILRATIARIDRFSARQAPLLFTAPRVGGLWAWPIVKLDLGETNLRATLGPVEH
jgi:hypothetical protein